MAANYAEIGRVGKLEADFQQISVVESLRNFYNIVVKNEQLNISKEK